MKKISLFLALPIVAILALTGCGDKNSTPAPTTPAPVVSTTPSVTPPPVTETPVPPVATGAPAAVGTDAGMENTVKSYNDQVKASNDKAKDVIDAYNHQIQSATGK
jgi:hypothetical protein